MDYVFRRLALDYLSFEDRAGLGIYSADERQRHLETGSYEPPMEDTGSSDQLIADAASARWSRAPQARLETPEAGRRRSSEPSRPKDARRRSRPPRSTAKPAPREAHTSAELMEKLTGTAVDSPLCMTCGTKMRPAGSCYVCEGCGSTSGCS